MFSIGFRKNCQYSEKQRIFFIIQGLENQEELEDYIDAERKILKAVGDYCHRELQSVGIKGIQSEGGYYYMPDFEICRAGFAKKGIVNGKEMCSAMLKEVHVALLPGSDFLRSETEFNVRLCYVDFDGKVAMDLLKNYANLDNKSTANIFVKRAAPRVVEGIKRLKAFVQSYS